MYKVLLCLLCPQLLVAQLVISEIMSNPAGSEHTDEFVEVYNRGPGVIQIKDWVFSDGTGIDTLDFFADTTWIEAGAYALILDPDHTLANSPYVDLIPSGTPLYTVRTDGTLGSGGLSNSSESVQIWSAGQDTVQHSWFSSTPNGYSLERLLLDSGSDPGTWQCSRVPNGTPGRLNSVTPATIDLACDSIALFETPHEANMPVLIGLSLSNRGIMPLRDLELALFRDADHDGSFLNEPPTPYSELIDSLLPGLDTLISVQLPGFPAGLQHLLIVAQCPGDTLPANDSLTFSLAWPYPRNAICINEIQYRPTTEQGGEWIELVNVSQLPISLEGWTWADAHDTWHPVSPAYRLLQPAEFIVLSQSAESWDYFGLNDASAVLLADWSALNTSGDSVRIRDASGRILTSLYYQGRWGASATSLERRDPNSPPATEWNWGPCEHPDGGTPGESNSILLPDHDLAWLPGIQSSVSNSPPSDMFSLSAGIRNTGRRSPEVLTATLSCGNRILARETYGSPLDTWDTLRMYFTNILMDPGLHELLLEVEAEPVGSLDTTMRIGISHPVGLLAINEIMARPLEDDAEYLELQNTSTTTISLDGWSLSDHQGTLGMIDTCGLAVPPGGFLVLSPDPGAIFPSCAPNALVFTVTPWPSLNNTTDWITLMDAGGREHLHYEYPEFPCAAGTSLERRALWLPATVDSNWTCSVAPDGGTPGAMNASALDPAQSCNLGLRTLSCSTADLHDEGVVEIDCRLVNFSVATFHDVRLFYCVYQFNEVLQEFMSVVSLIGPGSTVSLSKRLVVPGSGWLDLCIRLEAAGDAFPRDDSLKTRVYKMIESNALIINEIQPLPNPEQAEWVELYNRSQRSWSLLEFTLGDASGDQVTVQEDLRIEAGGYALICATGFPPVHPAGTPLIQLDLPSLNNTDDTVILRDPNGHNLEAVPYSLAADHPTGRSLERIQAEPGIRSENWGISLAENGHSAGKPNSLLFSPQANALSDPEIILIDNPFTPDGDGVADQLELRYSLPWPQGRATIEIFDLAGRSVCLLANQVPIPCRGQFTWDGSWKFTGRARMGLYILRVSLEAPNGGVYTSFHKIYLARA